MSTTIIKNSTDTDTFPREITFKAVFRAQSSPKENIQSCLSNHNVEHTLSQKKSKNSSFVSFTISAYYTDEKLLNSVCDGISSITGFMMMI